MILYTSVWNKQAEIQGQGVWTKACLIRSDTCEKMLRPKFFFYLETLSSVIILWSFNQ